MRNKQNIAVTGLTLDKTKVSLVKGTKIKINATVKPSNASNKKVNWRSVNTSVAKVNNKGEITAVEEIENIDISRYPHGDFNALTDYINTIFPQKG